MGRMEAYGGVWRCMGHIVVYGMVIYFYKLFLLSTITVYCKPELQYLTECKLIVHHMLNLTGDMSALYASVYWEPTVLINPHAVVNVLTLTYPCVAVF